MVKKSKNNPTIALVYDKVNTPFGGAEVVLKAISELFPKAPLYTSIYDHKKANWANNLRIVPSFLQKIPFLNGNHQILLPLMPLAFESLNLDAYDLIISVTSAEAKGIITKPNQKHICYLLTPTRYLYSHKETYLKSKLFLNLPIIKNLAKLVLSYITYWDQTASKRPDTIIPISKLVAKRIKTYYQRTASKVIYPPVSIEFSKKELENIKVLDTPPFLLSVSRLVDYKKVDLSILSALKLEKTLVVCGDGESKQKLVTLAGDYGIVKNENESLATFIKRAELNKKTILFTGKISTKEVHILYKNCRVLLMPGQEDFGITALEAGIFAKPVIVFYTSGVSELLVDNKHAVFIKKETVSEMIYALGKIDSLEFDADRLRENALKHTVKIFKKEFKNKIEQELKG